MAGARRGRIYDAGAVDVNPALIFVLDCAVLALMALTIIVGVIPYCIYESCRRV